MSLKNAPDEVKLAVDLIQLLEEHELPSHLVLAALEIVRRDYLHKAVVSSGTAGLDDKTEDECR